LYGYVTQEEINRDNPNKDSIILSSDDVNKNPALAKGKIFHFWSCKTGASGGLGETLVRSCATAFVGYNQKINISMKSTEEIQREQFEPDCQIAKSIMDGKDPKEAVRIGKMSFFRLGIKYMSSKLITKNPLAVGNAIRNSFALVYIDKDSLGITCEENQNENQGNDKENEDN